MDGMVSGICIDWEKEKLTIILVPNAAPEKPNQLGLPGGRIGADETPEQAIVREWKEEVWGHGTPAVKFFARMRKGSKGKNFWQYLFAVEETGRQEMRKSGVRGEVRAPIRVPLWSIARGEVEVFFSHKLGLLHYLEKKAVENREAAHLFMVMEKNMKKIRK